MQSGLTFSAISGLTSGSGLAIAKIIGSLFNVFSIYSVNVPGPDTPISTSAPTHASLNVLNGVSMAS